MAIVQAKFDRKSCLRITQFRTELSNRLHSYVSYNDNDATTLFKWRLNIILTIIPVNHERHGIERAIIEVWTNICRLRKTVGSTFFDLCGTVREISVNGCY